GGAELLLGRFATHAVSPVDAEEPEGASPLRARPVDEEVRDLVLDCRLGRGFWNELEECPLQIVDPGARRSGHGECREDAEVLDLEDGRLPDKVELVQDDDLRPLVQAGTVAAQLAVYGHKALGHGLSGIDDVEEETRPLEMREELIAEPDSP